MMLSIHHYTFSRQQTVSQNVQILFDCSDMRLFRIVKFIASESILVDARNQEVGVGGEGEWGIKCLMGTEFQSRKVKIQMSDVKSCKTM